MKLLKPIQLVKHGWVPSIQSKPKRRAIMVLVAPVVFVEYILNGPVGFINDFMLCWNYEAPTDDEQHDEHQ